MRIGIDAHILGKHKGGVETVLYNVIHSLGYLEDEHEYFIYVTSKHTLQTSLFPPRFHFRRLIAGSPWVERLFLIPYLFKRDRLDVIHLQRALPFWGCG